MPTQPKNTKDSGSESSNGFSVKAPSISLPKGGGAIRGIGEKFTANPVTGTGSLSVPIYASLGRAGFNPQLSLSYDSGAGNGIFGLGWNLSTPSITRKTDKGLPLYHDAEESDVFILSGSEDLVPIPEDSASGQLYKQTYHIQRYRPRIEGLFARIERWTNADNPSDILWRSISKDNITTWYGKTLDSRIVDNPDNPERVYSWLISESCDDKGNAILYRYKREDSARIDVSQAHEQNRSVDTRSTNCYLKRIMYGSHTPRLHDEDLTKRADWLFEVVFDYEEGHYQPLETDADGQQFIRASNQESGDWLVRADPFSTYRAGFEVRTYRLCRRVLMFHHFPQELGIADCLVRSTEFSYIESPIASFITAITQSGYVHKPRQNTANRYLKKSLPPLEFEYSKIPGVGELTQQEVEFVSDENLENLPSGLDGTRYRWVDLDGEGLSGILTEQGGAWFYKPNWSGLPLERYNGQADDKLRFGSAKCVAAMPSLADLNGGRQQLLDLAGDGQLDLVLFHDSLPGFFERSQDEAWHSFTSFESIPNINWDDPNLKFIDLNGDGHADILITEEHAFTWYPSLAEKGFGASQQVLSAADEEVGPHLLFADGTQSIYLADMSGDGLNDIVRIHNGAICYWSNLGYGRFGAKVTMDNAPLFDHPDLFDQQRIRLVDIDGSGTTDIIYLARDTVTIYRNEAGNRWSDPEPLPNFPQVDNLTSVMAIDLLGNGTACLVWSSPHPADSGRHMRYIDLMNGQKPHLLTKIINNLGAEIDIQYAPSTKFYLTDKWADKSWITKVPFPVHVVEQVVTHDHISDNRFTTRYAYHHGYFDGIEREFRGFGMVEQWDTEEFAVLQSDTLSPVASNLDAAFAIPPIHTRTWFHTGVYLDREHVSRQFENEYYREAHLNAADFRAQLLPDTVLADDLTLDEEREACRALKGMMLRQEVYTDDALPDSSDAVRQKALIPYTVTEQNFTIKRLQSRGDNRHAVFFSHAREVINYHYERQVTDPRITHTMTLQVDNYGNVLRQISIGYGRRQDASTLHNEDKVKQEQTLITYTENRPTNAINTDTDYRTPLPAATCTYELTGFEPENGVARFSFDEFIRNDFELLTSAIEVEYEQAADGNTQQKRLIEHICTLYRPNDLGETQHDVLALLPLGTIESLALTGESYKLALTTGLIAQVYQRKQTDETYSPLLPMGEFVSLLEEPNEGGYIAWDGKWWIPSGRTFFSPNRNDDSLAELTHARQHFFLPHRYRDPFDTDAIRTESFVTYDDYNLLMVATRDALKNTITVSTTDDNGVTTISNDYRVLQPYWLTDPNGNRTRVVFDALGMLMATAVMGKPGEDSGDDINEAFIADISLAAIQDFVQNPRAQANALLDTATTRILYDLDRYQRCQQPPFAATLAREIHTHDLENSPSPIQISFSYSDGFGREIQKKIQAEEGDAPQRQAVVALSSGDIHPGDLLRDAEDKLLPPAITSSRWVGTGRTVFNNKGKPVKQYEPFFSITHLYEPEREVTDTGVTRILIYDPLERVIATLHPNHTYEKVVFTPWQQTTYDVNDTIVPRRLPDESPFNPVDDRDVGYCFARLPEHEYLPTWYDLRTDSAKALLEWADADEHGNAIPENAKRRLAERLAAEKTALHTDTPTIAHFDVLGRPFLTIVHNRYERDGAIFDEQYATRVELDIEGNQRAVKDERKLLDDKLQQRIVMQYDYDMLSNRIHQASMEAGERWILSDIAGNPIRTWDSRGFKRRMTYDALRRPLDLWVTQKDDERLAERTVYGETLGDSAIVHNHHTRVYRVYDGAGVVTNKVYDFKGNLRATVRELLPDYRNAVDWAQNPNPNDGSYVTNTTYDALNRPTKITTPDASTYLPGYNEANLLNSVNVKLRNAATETPFVTNIDYDAKGQRERIVYGNGAETNYKYDRETFRLVHMKSTRPSGLNSLSSHIFVNMTIVQDLYYTYDPTGNITRIEDASLKTVFHHNQQVEPINDYTYDAIYRLIEAKGREHIGQMEFDFEPSDGNYHNHPFAGLNAHPNDLQALRNYCQIYEYDEVGNFEWVHHIANGRRWSLGYWYTEKSLIEDNKNSNRLSRTRTRQDSSRLDSYTYDEHGNMISMPHLPAMVWDFEDQLQQTTQQVRNDGAAETTYYVYDAGGQRVRKVTVNQHGQKVKERIYLGAYEVYYEYDDAETPTLKRETLHIMDDKQRIALVDTQTEPTVKTSLIRYQLGNHLGSVSVELDSNSNLISYEEYHPYGTTAFQAGRTTAEVSLKRYRYTGKERDEESGLYYHGARYYAAWLGRWTSCDPNGLGDGANLYFALRANPVSKIDPDGRATVQAKLNDVVEYKDKIANKEALGRNVQKDHPIAQGKKALYRTDPTGKTNTKPRKELTVVTTTGKKTNELPEEPHTTKTNNDVSEQKRLKREGIKSYSADIVEPSRTAAIDAGMKATSVNEAVLDQMDQDFLSQNLADTAKDVKSLEEGTFVGETDSNRKDLNRLDTRRTTQPFDEKVAIENNEAVKKYRADKAGKLAQTTGETVAKEAPSKLTKLVKGVGEVVMKKGGKLLPVLGTGLGAGLAANEAAKGNYAASFVEAAGASEIPIVAQVADVGSLVADIAWVVKDVLDPEQKLEEWWRKF